MNTRLGFFPYNGMNYKAAQRWLDRKAAQGWALKHVWLGSIAHLQRAESPSHFVDLEMRSDFEGGTDADYLQLCSDAGWELVQQIRGMLLFRAAEGKSPAPIQTDGGLEWERFWDRYRPRLWSTVLVLAAVGLVVLMLSLPSRATQNFTARLAMSSSLLYFLYIAMGVLYIALEWVHSTWYLARCRRSGQVEDPGPLATFLDTLVRLQTPTILLCFFLSAAQLLTSAGKTVDLALSPYNDKYSATVEACQVWPVVMARDLDLPDSDDSRHLEGFRSVLMDFLEYREITDGQGPDTPLHILTTERYDCAAETLAKWVIGWRREETRKGAFLWGGLEWEPVSDGLGFEECYACRGGSYLLFRQGKLVVLAGCSDVDLTTPEHLDTLRSRTFPKNP